MKKTLQNTLKVGAVVALMLSAGAVSAQQITGASTKIEDKSISKELNGTIRVIDNKGTKKFLQVKNGLTLLTDQTPDGGVTSTWQLGGTLSSNTYIDATGKTFSLDGLKLVTTAKAAAAATDQSVRSSAKLLGSTGTAAVAANTGWTVLIRDEQSGEIQKILASDFISTGSVDVTLVTPVVLKVTAAGLAMGTPISKVSVYRNGAKLRASTDYAITAADEVTLKPSTIAGSDWTAYAGDVIEVQWIK